MKRTFLLAIITLSLFSCKKEDNNNETAYNGAFPKTIVSEVAGSVGTVKTTEVYTVDSENRITFFTRKVVDNNTPTTDEAYTINYNGNAINSIVIKNNSQSNKDYTYTFSYNNGLVQSISRNDNNLKISYDYADGKVSTKTVEFGGDKRTFSYSYSSNKIEMISRQIGVSQNDRFTYILNTDGTVASLEKVVYINDTPNNATKGNCSYSYDDKVNIFSRDVFKYLAEIECVKYYNFYGSHQNDPLLKVAKHNIINYTKNLFNNTHADYQDLENASRSFSYEWNSDNTPKSMEYKKGNVKKGKFSYSY